MDPALQWNALVIGMMIIGAVLITAADLVFQRSHDYPPSLWNIGTMLLVAGVVTIRLIEIYGGVL